MYSGFKFIYIISCLNKKLRHDISIFYLVTISVVIN